MAHVIVQNTRSGEAPVEPARRDDGTRYDYGMYFNEGRSIAWGDGFEDLIEVLSPGYQAADEQQALIERITLALRARKIVQAQVFAEADDGDVEALNPEEMSILDGTHQGRITIEDWNSDIPLVLVTTAYQPHTDTPRPVSKHGPYLEVPNMWWIDPMEDESLIRDLAAIGYVRVVETVAPDDIERHLD